LSGITGAGIHGAPDLKTKKRRTLHEFYPLQADECSWYYIFNILNIRVAPNAFNERL
jgi:hypothetical protein